MTWDETRGWIFGAEAHKWMDGHICAGGSNARNAGARADLWARAIDGADPVAFLGLAQLKDAVKLDAGTVAALKELPGGRAAIRQEAEPWAT